MDRSTANSSGNRRCPPGNWPPRIRDLSSLWTWSAKVARTTLFMPVSYGNSKKIQNIKFLFDQTSVWIDTSFRSAMCLVDLDGRFSIAHPDEALRLQPLPRLQNREEGRMVKIVSVETLQVDLQPKVKRTD